MMENDLPNEVRRLLSQDDKRKHFLCGALIGMLSLFIAVLAGIVKEVDDFDNGGKFDTEDIKATIYGGFVGRIVSIVLIFAYYILSS